MFTFGVDYYPEHWPEERWPEDARLMAAAGFNVVRLAEFAWSRLEPASGTYGFDWLDRAIETLAANGLRVVLGTPTASPPAWLMTAHPDAFLTRETGHAVTYGNRRNYSPWNEAYREHTRRIVTAMAARYHDHAAVIGWQIDNEFGDRDYDAPAFRRWLQRRFGSLEALNERWGTAFWSHSYTDWEQIPVPLTTGGVPNPGLALDFYRFCSDAYVQYQRLQVDILRERCPQHFITHNLMGFRYPLIDYFDLAADLDLVTWDNYPRGFWDIAAEVDPSTTALGHATMRGLKGKPFWVMESQAGAGGWDIVSVAPKPGEIRLWAYQAIAHGADGIVFFRWRTARHGTEQYWHGLLEHDARAGRRYDEAKAMGQEIARIGAVIEGAEVRADVAMVLSYDARFALEIQAHNPAFSYPEQFQALYRALHRRGVTVDVVAPDADLSPYRVVVAPNLYVLSQATASSLERFVEAGGALLVTTRSGVKDEGNAIVERALPGLLTDLCGVVVDEYDSLPTDVSNPIVLSEGAAPEAAGGVWCDVLHATTAQVLGRYGSDHYAGRAALTVNAFGSGHALYLGTVGNEPLVDAVIERLLALGGVPHGPRRDDGVEVATRTQGDTTLLFVLNHAGQARTVSIDAQRFGVLVGEHDGSGELTVPAYGVVVLSDGAATD